MYKKLCLETHQGATADIITHQSSKKDGNARKLSIEEDRKSGRYSSHQYVFQEETRNSCSKNSKDESHPLSQKTAL